MSDHRQSSRSPARMSTNLSRSPSLDVQSANAPGAPSAVPVPVSAPAAATGSSRFTESLLNSALATALAVPTTAATTTNPGDSSRRQPLSIQTTTQNFKRFVAKSGPLFWVTDQAESILLWDDAYKTIFFALLWALICYRPTLLALAPSVALMAVLMATYFNAYPDGHLEDKAQPRRPNAALKPGEAPAGSIDYLDNLQHIQEVMGRAAHATDVGRSYLPFLDWTSHPQVSLYLFLAAAVTSCCLAFLHHLIPWRLLLAVAGEAALAIGHPHILAQLRSLQRRQKLFSEETFKATANSLRMQCDGLPDSVVDSGLQSLLVVQVEEEEAQSRDGQWSQHKLIPPLDPSTRSETGQRLPPSGYEWAEAGDTWTVDYNLSRVDAGLQITAGWVEKSGEQGHKTRRRRWLRIAVKLDDD